MLDVLKPLLESGLVNEETRTAINEAWQSKVKEIQSEARTEVREELAGRYEHDKEVMIKTLDRMVSETLTKEIESIKEERNQVAKLRVKTVKEMRDAAKRFNAFATRALAEELAEFAQERKLTEAHKQKLERFIMASLAEEITEFAEDKKNLIETRVRLISEAKAQLDELRQKFVARSSKAVSKIVSETLNHEITQLHGDIKVARQNNFGRKIYEAFATEFTGTYLNENALVRSIKGELAETKQKLAKTAKLAESRQHDLAKISSRAERANVLSELLAPLDRNKKAAMSTMLESVQTPQLRTAYDRYLPAVLGERTKTASDKSILHESTGDKAVKTVVQTTEDPLADIMRLAGYKN